MHVYFLWRFAYFFRTLSGSISECEDHWKMEAPIGSYIAKDMPNTIILSCLVCFFLQKTPQKNSGRTSLHFLFLYVYIFATQHVTKLLTYFFPDFIFSRKIPVFGVLFKILNQNTFSNVCKTHVRSNSKTNYSIEKKEQE